MPRVVVTGWKVGFNKVECTKTLQTSCGLGLSDAKKLTDAILDGQTSAVEMPSESEAAAVVDRLKKLGAVAHVETAL